VNSNRRQHSKSARGGQPNDCPEGGARLVYFADGQPQGLNSYQSQSTGVAKLAGRYAAAMTLVWQV